MKIRGKLIVLFSSALIAIAGTSAMSQSPPSFSDSSDSSPKATIVSTLSPAPAYTRPTERSEFNNFVFDAVGPYPIVGSAVAAGINQYTNSPPEWNQGLKGYSRRLGSDFGIAAVSTTTRYALSEAMKEDSLYYRCECKGVLPRLSYAVLSTMTARRGNDGHRVFSIPALIAPYAGTMTAIYGWYPDRYNAKDALRMGNYSLLAYAGGNIALEFLYSGPHSLFARMHLNNPHGSPDPGPNH